MQRKQSVIKDHAKENLLFNNRCFVALIMVLGFTLILIIRLGFLQIKDHRFYSTLSQHNLLNVIPITPNRGLIYDRNGILLAKNIPAFTLAIIPNNLHNLHATITRLNKIIPLSSTEIKRFYHILYQYRPYQPVPLKFQLTEGEVARFYVNQYQFPGIIIQTRMLRYYLQGNIMSDVIGYVGHINQNELQQVNTTNYNIDNDIGKTGIEKYYENQLHGKIGIAEAEINANGHVVRVLKRVPPIPGNNIYLTIDSRLQAEATKAMGQESGAIVVIQPSTGQILAMVSKPSYDPNTFIAGLSREDYHKLLNAPNQPLYNRAIRGQFAAGSTVKPFFGLAGLNTQVITPHDKIYDPGWFQLPNSTHIYHDWKPGGHGWVDLKKAIVVSCDKYFYMLAVRLGIERMTHALRKFGFGSPTDVDMPAEAAGLVPTPTWKMGAKGRPWYIGDTVEAGIGQGLLLVTPLQLAQAVARIAERGHCFKPYLLLKTISTNGTVQIQAPIAEPPITLKNPKYWDVIIHAMQGVVGPSGTARRFGGYTRFTVAAKTGTAQIFGHQRDEDATRTNIPKNLRNNHLFIAFAPVHHPQIALAIVVEHSAMADKIAGDVMNYYFHHPLPQMPPTDEK